ncbi:MAG: ATP-binding protein [Thermoplasmata archaeon]|nr:ATP-binding protein [Thermoplasmata archaeon]
MDNDSRDDTVEEARASYDDSTESHDTSGVIGIVYGDVGTSELKCSVMAPLEKGEYVQIPHESCGAVLGQVDTMERKTNLSLDKAIQMSHGEVMDIEEKVLATITIIGYRDERGLLQTPKAPFKAGSPLIRADDELISKVIGLKHSEKTGAYIGLLNGHDIPIQLDINEMVQKHVSILAKTGGGKSYMSGVLVEELLKHNVTVMIIDPHGEYSSLRDEGKVSELSEKFGVKPHGYASQISEFSPDTKVNKDAKPLKFTLANLEARDILALTHVKNLRHALPAMKKILDTIKVNKQSFTMKDIIRTLEAQEDAQNANLIQELQYLDEINIFAEHGTKLDELVKKGNMTVLNLRGSPPEISGLIVNRVLTSLFEMRKINAIPPMLVVTEEAHNYCPQQGTTACSKIMRTIASEGRKFGLGLVIITQRAAKVDKNVLSQCGTQVILKITNPLDLKAVISSVEGLTTGVTEEIQQLPIGVAIVCGGGVQVPLFVRVRPRETRHGGESVKIIED